MNAFAHPPRIVIFQTRPTEADFYIADFMNKQRVADIAA